MKNLFIALALATLSAAPAYAYDFSGCQVTEIVLAGENNAHVRLSCSAINTPACATAKNFIGFDKSTTGGKQYLAMLMMAHAMNGKVEGTVDHSVCAPHQGNVPLLAHLRVVLNQ